MEIKDRLNILLDAGQISEENQNIMLRIISILKEKWGIEITEENGGMFITHLTMAYERIKNGNEINCTAKEVSSQLNACKDYEKSKTIFEDVKKELFIELPKAEEEFILLYLCVVLDNQ